MTTLQIDDLHVRRGRREVLHGIDLTVEAGEVLAILGPNGAGKSTLLETVGRILPASSGGVSFDGRVATVMQNAGLARRTALANVELALAWWGTPRGERRERALTALASLRAEHLADRAATRLSGGERRRVHLARGLAIRPDLLLLDEPFAGLDPEAHAALLADAGTALRAAAGSVVVVVHDRNEAWALADRIAILVEGRLVATGPPQRLLDAPPTVHVARFLGYDGELRQGGRLTLTRPAHIVVDPTGDLEATVTRVLPAVDASHVELAVEQGTLRAVVPPGAAVGDRLRIRVIGGATFDD
jgi:ABC-type sugar transport system ATPase subunit